jgi:BAR domain
MWNRELSCTDVTPGMDKMHKSMNLYVKAISKRSEAEDKEKNLPVGYLGRAMINHGEDFENDSEFGQCLIGNQIVRFYAKSLLTSIDSIWSHSGEARTSSGDLCRQRYLNLARVSREIAGADEGISDGQEEAGYTQARIRYVAYKVGATEERGFPCRRGATKC